MLLVFGAKECEVRSISISLLWRRISPPNFLPIDDLEETKNSFSDSKMLFLDDSRDMRVWKVLIANPLTLDWSTLRELLF